MQGPKSLFICFCLLEMPLVLPENAEGINKIERKHHHAHCFLHSQTRASRPVTSTFLRSTTFGIVAAGSLGHGKAVVAVISLITRGQFWVADVLVLDTHMLLLHHKLDEFVVCR